MSEPSDLRAYLAHLRERRIVAAIIVSTALVASVVFSLLQTPRYTASVALIIEPPASSDPRAAMAVSPIYLESLRTFEHFASSDQLFAAAASEFGLRAAFPDRPLESLKNSVLRVSIPRNTKILKIEVTLPDAARAHALATHLAQQTVELSRRTGLDADQELIERARGRKEETANAARAAYEALEQAMRRSPARDALQAEMQGLRERRTEVERLVLSASLSEADLKERAQSVASFPGADADDADYTKSRLRAASHRLTRLQQESSALQAKIAEIDRILTARNAEVEGLATAYKLAQAASENAAARSRDLEGIAGFRAERISLFDPGFVPERPSSPNVPLNVFFALTLAVMACLGWFTVEFAWNRRSLATVRELPKVAGRQ